MPITHVRKWGNSYGIRISRETMERMGIAPDTRIEMVEESGSIRLTLLKSPQYSLSELLEKVTPENVHKEIGTGEAIGNEAW